MLRPHSFFGAPDPDAGEWSWSFDGASEAAPAHVKSPRFVTRLDAQGWLGEHLNELRTAGHTSAQLTHRGQVVGAPVAL